MRKDLLIYISGPITPRDGFSVEQNVANSLPIFFECLRRGWPAFLPHTHGSFPTAHMVMNHTEWLEYDMMIINRCTHMLMLPRWERSEGSIIERNHALEIGLLVCDSMEMLEAIVGK